MAIQNEGISKVMNLAYTTANPLGVEITKTKAIAMFGTTLAQSPGNTKEPTVLQRFAEELDIPRQIVDITCKSSGGTRVVRITPFKVPNPSVTKSFNFIALVIMGKGLDSVPISKFLNNPDLGTVITTNSVSNVYPIGMRLVNDNPPYYNNPTTLPLVDGVGNTVSPSFINSNNPLYTLGSYSLKLFKMSAPFIMNPNSNVLIDISSFKYGNK